MSRDDQSQREGIDSNKDGSKSCQIRKHQKLKQLIQANGHPCINI
uniref:Uncharacterized protein n=1 Tax=Rhizophora mucronata TaxID=61149 RepID=A0A2P2R405_RHIMU